MIYTLERVRTHNGYVKEREGRRKGQRVRIQELALGEPLQLVYIDDDNRVLRTSCVEAHTSDWEREKHLTVQTRNTVYSFKKVSND